MKRMLVIAAQAEADIVAILEYTEKNWGSKQAGRYAAVLQKGLERLIHNTQLGRPRPDISPLHYSLVIEKYTAIYRLTKTTVEVSRIVHHARDYAHDPGNI
jgi:plasmid stabilization system protein ParE